MRPHPLLAVVIVSIAFAAGCSEPRNEPVVRPARPDTAQATTAENQTGSEATNAVEKAYEPKSMIAPIELIDANWNELQTLVAAQQGKIVVVDIWSTACEPCMTEFPHLIALQKDRPNDVVAISYDIDFVGIKNKPPTYYRERVLHFLESQPANQVLHRMCTTPADELFTALELGSIPAIYVYGRDGKLAKRFDESDSQGKGLSYKKQVIPFVDELLK
jgi:thiol-disulfide isomerase/thioredoxin